MRMNWTILDEAAYKDRRWDLLVNVEEGGDPESLPYLDGKGIPTIGLASTSKMPPFVTRF